MILLSDVPSEEEAGDSAACSRSLADMSLALTAFPLACPVDLRVLGQWPLARSYPEYLVAYQRC
jgi:hypothetical protein